MSDETEYRRLAGVRTSCFLWFHDWDKWTPYDAKRTFVPTEGPTAGQRIELNEFRQRRVCRRCGFMQDRVVEG
jgi:hypothetical protein